MVNLDQVEMFISFLELVKYPEKYTKMLEDMKARSDELKQVVEAYTDVKSANKYYDKLKQEHALRLENLNKQQDEFQKAAERFEREKQEEVIAREQRVKKLEQRHAEVLGKEQQVMGLFDVQRVQLDDLNKDRVSLNGKREDLEKREVALREKEAQLKKILGS